MKKHLTKKALLQSILSALVCGSFILFATGSFESLLAPYIIFETQDLGDDVKKETITPKGNIERSSTGKRDNEGKWDGTVIIEWEGDSKYTEEAYFVHGARQGWSKRTYPDGHIEKDYYVDNEKTKKDEKGAHSSTADISAFQVLCNKYPWFLFSLNAFGFNTSYVQAYMNGVETSLSTYTYDVSKFSDYYNDAVDVLGETPYDSIITLNSSLTLIQGLHEMKNSEFRLAILGRYRSSGNSTFNIISTTYPGYLLTMNGKGVNSEDFKVFCQDMDSRMTGYGVLNLKDPFFVDSVDARMFRALLAILNTDKSFILSAESSQIIMPQLYKSHNINDIYNEVISILKPSFTKSTPKEVGTIVMTHMLEQYYVPSEMIRQVVMEAYFIKGGVVMVPTAATVFESNISATSVTLEGYVLGDGGAAVTSRGIAWATFYAPTTKDNPINSGTGTGNFKVTLNGLTPGTTYYARTFATNSAGTAYGNTVSFVASVTTDVNDIKISDQEFTIYPNPASSLTTFRFQVGSPGSLTLNIIDMKGKIVLTKDLDNLSQGENQVILNLSLLQNGMYICQLTIGATKVSQKLVISR
jgi:hypothetical protein